MLLPKRLTSASTLAIISALSDPSVSLEDRGIAARFMYWNYAFDFHRDGTFALQSLDFIENGGLILLLNLATHGIGNEIDYQTLVIELQSIHLCVECGCRSRPFPMTGDGKACSLIDMPFQLPPQALSYDSRRMIGIQVERVTLRQLAVEILSDMLNYDIYRSALGRVKNSIRLLLKLALLLQRRFLSANHLPTKSNEEYQSKNLFMLERVVNIFASLAYESGFVEMSADRQSFRLIFAFKTCLMLNYRNADENLSAYLLLQLTPLLQQLIRLQAAGSARLIRSVMRFYANALPHANERIMYRLARWNLSELLRGLFVHYRELVESEAQGEEEEFVETTVQAYDQTMSCLLTGMDRLWTTVLFNAEEFGQYCGDYEY
jgi:hypothetical protein